tara:strand:+ start:915 stop:1058 length:144 start_codon:yes stop_codon:yes gene_type:complete
MLKLNVLGGLSDLENILLLAGGLAQENFDSFTSLKLNDTNCDVRDLA